MSSQKYASPLHIELKPSATLSYVLIFMHLGALLCVLPLDLSPGIRIAMAIAVIVSFILTFGGRWHWFPHTLVTLMSPRWGQSDFNSVGWNNVVWDADDKWVFIGSQGREPDSSYQASLLAGSFVHPKLTVLNFVIHGVPWYQRRKALVLLTDNMDATVFRHLRVRLRWYANGDAQDNLGALK